MKVLKVLALTGVLALAAVSASQAGGSFWFYHFAHPGQVVFNSRAYDTQDECEAAARVKYNQGKWLVGRCQDSDNDALTGD